MARLPRQFRKSIAIYHAPTASGKAAYPASADVTVEGSFLPMDRYQHALEGIDMVDPFEVYVPSGTDLRVTDKLVIDSVTYYVRKVFPGDDYTGGLKHKRAAVSKSA